MVFPRDKNGKCLVITDLYTVIVLRLWFPTFFSLLPTFDVTDPQLPTTIYYRSLPQLYQSERCAKIRSTCLQVSCFHENIGKEQKMCLQAYIFDNGVTLPTEESHITPRG